VVATPGVNSGGNCACKFWEELAWLMCRPNIEVVGLPGGTDLWLTVPKFQNPWFKVCPSVGIACVVAATVEAVVPEVGIAWDAGATCRGWCNRYWQCNRRGWCAWRVRWSCSNRLCIILRIRWVSPRTWCTGGVCCPSALIWTSHFRKLFFYFLGAYTTQTDNFT